MQILQPQYLYFALLLIPALLLYLFRKKPKKLVVSTLIFFKTLAYEHQESPWLRKLKKLLSLLLTLLALLALVAAMTKIVRVPGKNQYRNVLILLDRSASMAAKDKKGRSRMDVAKEQLRKRIQALPHGVSMLLAVFDQRTLMLVPRTYEKSEVLRTLHSLQPRPLSGNAESAMRWITPVVQNLSGSVIWYASDNPLPEDTSKISSAIETIPVALKKPQNAGITAFDMRPLPLRNGEWSVFAKVAHNFDSPKDIRMEVLVDGKLHLIRDIGLIPGRKESVDFSIKPGIGKLMTVIINSEDDALEDDNRVIAEIPDKTPLRILRVADKNPDPFLELALLSLEQEGELEFYKSAPDVVFSKFNPDAIVFDSCLPKTFPKEIPYFLSSPPDSDIPIHIKRLKTPLPIEKINVLLDEHPLLYCVAEKRVNLQQTSIVKNTGMLISLWKGPAGPLLLAGEQDRQRIAISLFSPESSFNLPLTSSFPVLTGNIIYWLTEQKREAKSNIIATGTIIKADNAKIKWTTGEKDKTQSFPCGQYVEIDRQGIWELSNGQKGSASLLSEKETNLSGLDKWPKKSTENIKMASGWFTGDITPSILWMVFFLLIIEAALFHRWAVY